MAFTPCAMHGAKYAGGASTFFLRLVHGGEQRGGKLQTCANCATLTLELLAQRFQKVSEGEVFFDYAEPIACANCGGNLGDRQQAFFGNAYPRGHSESQWYGQVCANCVEAVAEDLHLDSARVRP